MNISAKLTNADGNFGVLSINGKDFHGPLPPNDGVLRAAYDAWIAQGNTPTPYTVQPTPPAPTVWGDVFRRMTDAEADTFDTLVKTKTKRFQWLVQKTQYIDRNDPLFTTLDAAFAAAFGRTRADELLAPS